MVTINIGRKEAVFFLVFVLIAFSAFVVVAYNSGSTPDVMGHSVDEIEGVSKESVWVQDPSYVLQTWSVTTKTISAGTTVVGSGGFVLPLETKEVLLDASAT